MNRPITNPLAVIIIRTTFMVLAFCIPFAYFAGGVAKFTEHSKIATHSRAPVLSSRQYAALNADFDMRLRTIGNSGMRLDMVEFSKQVLAVKAELAAVGLPNKHLNRTDNGQVYESYDFIDPRTDPLLVKAAYVVRAANLARIAHDRITPEATTTLETAAANEYWRTTKVTTIAFQTIPFDVAPPWYVSLSTFWLRGMVCATALLGCLVIARGNRFEVADLLLILAGPAMVPMTILIINDGIDRSVATEWRRLVQSRRAPYPIPL